MEKQTVTIFRTRGYRGYEKTYSLELLAGGQGLPVSSAEYYVPRGWSLLQDKGQTVALRSKTGELIRYFMANSGDTPGVRLADGAVVFFKKAKDNE